MKTVGGKINKFKKEKIMKNIILAISFVLISSSIYSQTKIFTDSYSGGQDSLLFDGANSSFIATGNDCKVKVTYVHGIATGSRCVMVIHSVCGVKDSEEVCKAGKIFTGDKLKAGEKISTGPDGYLTIMLSDGKLINFDKNTSIVINSNYCDNNFKTQVLLEEGILFIDAKPNKDIKGINVTTKYGTAIIEGTEFSYESINESGITTDVLKVFDGSVKFQNNLQNREIFKSAQDKGAEIKKLNEDYQGGKISLEEFQKKLPELQTEMIDATPKSAITVNAGFQSKIVGTKNPTAPESFDVNENRWFDDANK